MSMIQIRNKGCQLVCCPTLLSGKQCELRKLRNSRLFPFQKYAIIKPWNRMISYMAYMLWWRVWRLTPATSSTSRMICAEKMLKNQGPGGREEGVDFLTPKKTLSDMTEGAVHQGFVLRVSEFAYADLSVILEKQSRKTIPHSHLGRSDRPHNFGSILRTADATQVAGIIIPKHRAVGVTPVVAKTSTGAVAHVPIA